VAERFLAIHKLRAILLHQSENADLLGGQKELWKSASPAGTFILARRSIICAYAAVSSLAWFCEAQVRSKTTCFYPKLTVAGMTPFPFTSCFAASAIESRSPKRRSNGTHQQFGPKLDRNRANPFAPKSLTSNQA
jgi:hypothetical protein